MYIHMNRRQFLHAAGVIAGSIILPQLSKAQRLDPYGQLEHAINSPDFGAPLFDHFGREVVGENFHDGRVVLILPEDHEPSVQQYFCDVIRAAHGRLQTIGSGLNVVGVEGFTGEIGNGTIDEIEKLKTQYDEDFLELSKGVNPEHEGFIEWALLNEDNVHMCSAGLNNVLNLIDFFPLWGVSDHELYSQSLMGAYTKTKARNLEVVKRNIERCESGISGITDPDHLASVTGSFKNVKEILEASLNGAVVDTSYDNEWADVIERDKLRCPLAIKNLADHMDETGFRIAALPFGGAHADSLVKACQDLGLSYMGPLGSDEGGSFVYPMNPTELGEDPNY